MIVRIAGLLTLLAVLGCSSKQEVIAPTATIIAPTGELKLIEAGGGWNTPKTGNPK